MQLFCHDDLPFDASTLGTFAQTLSHILYVKKRPLAEICFGEENGIMFYHVSVSVLYVAVQIHCTDARQLVGLHTPSKTKSLSLALLRLIFISIAVNPDTMLMLMY